MRPGEALWAALGDLYRHSWRLVLLNAALSLVVLSLLLAAVWAPVALVAVALAVGPLAATLLHCALVLARTEDLELRCALAGLRAHWRRGLALGAVLSVVVGTGLFAIVTYAREGVWVLAAVVLYLLAGFLVFQIPLWPLALSERSLSAGALLRGAAAALAARPLQTVVLAVALTIVNLLGAAAALMPLLTLTLAYSALAVAHFALPRHPSQEAHG